MWIWDGSEETLGEVASKNNPDDLLNTELINSLGYMVGERYDGSIYDIESICVSTGLTRFLVCGLIQCDDFNYFSYIIGEDGIKRDVEDFYLD